MRKLTHQGFIKQYRGRYANNSITVVGKYICSRTNIDCKCSCGATWSATPNNLMKGSGCPRCGGQERYTTKTFKKTYQSKHGEDVTIIGEYVNSKTNIDCKCSCGATWSATPNNLMTGSGCPNCFSSKGEKYISNILTQLGIEFEEQFKDPSCIDKRMLTFDFRIGNILLEFDGNQHYEFNHFFHRTKASFQAQQKRDKIKTHWAKNNQYTLYRVRSTQEFEELLPKIKRLI